MQASLSMCAKRSTKIIFVAVRTGSLEFFMHQVHVLYKILRLYYTRATIVGAFNRGFMNIGPVSIAVTFGKKCLIAAFKRTSKLPTLLAITLLNMVFQFGLGHFFTAVSTSFFLLIMITLQVVFEVTRPYITVTAYEGTRNFGSVNLIKMAGNVFLATESLFTACHRTFVLLW